MKKGSKARKRASASKPKPSSKANTSSTAVRSKQIPIEQPLSLPSYVRDAIKVLSAEGHIAYVVGGSVRDHLLGIASKDHDIATSANPDELSRIFPDAIAVGKAFGVLKIPIEPRLLLEVATFRKESGYQDHRHPTKVEFSDPAEDAQRRDFTINALFFDPKTGVIIDYVDGLEDLRAKRLKAIGDPAVRFEEDALRLLRAVRFSNRLGFEIEAKTADSLKSKASLIKKISAERVRDELNLILADRSPDRSIEMLESSGILGHVLPELLELKGLKQTPEYDSPGDVWDSMLAAMKSLDRLYPNRNYLLSWGALLADIGKPSVSAQSSGKNYIGHELEGAKKAREILRRLRFSNHEIDHVEAMVLEHQRFREVFQMREATLQKWIRKPHFNDVLDLHHVLALSTDGNLAFHDFCQSQLEAYQRVSHTSDLIDGQDLIQLGLEPGPGFKQILETVEELALEKKLNSKEEALEFVVKHFVE